jgi:hypothetical protein
MMRNLLAMLILMCAAVLPAHAHKPSDSYLALEVSGDRIEGQWDIALRDLDVAIALDDDGDGQLTWAEIRRRHQAIAAYAMNGLTLSSSKGACTVTADANLIDRHTDGAYNVLRFHAVCPQALDALTINYTLFAGIDPQHKGLLRLTHAGSTQTAIFEPARARQTLSMSGPDRLAQLAAYVRNGMWHIWIGYDHILFLLSLLLPAVMLGKHGAPSESLKASLVDVVKVVTAFTLAHSLTLTLASLSLISLPSRLVESAIAASVILAAVNNIYPLLRGRRPLAAFVFGLIHGFGFASVLIDLGLPQGALALSLFGFNLGVEIGQLCIVALFLPLAFVLRGTWFYRRLLSSGSVLIALVAAVWLVERACDMKLIST